MATFFVGLMKVLGSVTATVITVYLIHEAGHAIAIFATGAGKVTGIAVTLKGIGICWDQHDPVLPWKLITISLAGPAANIFAALVAVAAGLPGTFILSQAVFAAFNMVFVWVPGSDGAKALRYGREVFFDKNRKEP